MSEFELIKMPSQHRHGQPGYYSLSDLPQRESISKAALGTGWWELDQLLKLYEGQFIVLSGAAGSGKSTFMFNLVCNVARNDGLRSFLYVPENEGFLRETLRDIWGDRGAFEDFAANQIFIQSSVPIAADSAPRTLDWILHKAATAIERDQVGMVVIDPWNEIEHAKAKDVSMPDFIGACIMEVKTFCRYFGVTVIMVAHPTKSAISEGRVPGLYDIDGSAHWANKADNGIIVARDDDKPISRVISRKVRERGAGKVGECYFHVNEKTGLFTPQHGAVT